MGLGGDPLGRKVLEDDVSGSAGSVSTGAEGAGGVSVCDTPVVDVTWHFRYISSFSHSTKEESCCC